jgi:hypothetical protein
MSLPSPGQSNTSPAARNNGSVAASNALITGPIRRRCTNQRREPGSQMAPARRRYPRQRSRSALIGTPCNGTATEPRARRLCQPRRARRKQQFPGGDTLCTTPPNESPRCRQSHGRSAGHSFAAARRTSSRNSASAASPRRWCSSGFISGTGPNRLDRGFRTVTTRDFSGFPAGLGFGLRHSQQYLAFLHLHGAQSVRRILAQPLSSDLHALIAA